MAGALPSHHRKDGSGDVHRPEKVGRQLLFDLLGRHLFEVALERGAGVVDQHVDAAERRNRSVDRRKRVGDAGHVERHHQQAIGRAENRRDLRGTPTSCNDRVARRQGRLGERHSHATTGTGDHPHPLVDHHASARSMVLCREAVECSL